MLWLYFSHDQFMKLVLDKSTGFIPFISFAVSGYSGYGLSRLNVFDKLDDLKEKDAVKINKQVSAFRASFENIFIYSLISGILIFIIGLIASSSPILQIFNFEINFKIIFGFIFGLTIFVIVILLVKMKKIFNSISELRNNVISLGLIEKRRKALLTKMYEQAEKNPFNEMDFHLKKYNQSINNDHK